MATLVETHLTGTIDPAAYNRRLNDLLQAIARLDDEAQQRALAMLADLAGDVAATLDTVTELTAPLYRTTLAEITAAVANFATTYNRDLTAYLTDAVQLGIGLATDPLTAAGALDAGAITVSRAVPPNLIDAAVNFTTDLVQGITEDLNRRITREVAAVAFGGQTPADAIAAIGRNLDTPNHFRTIAARARAISTTEVGRLQALATHRTQQDLDAYMRDHGHQVAKRWLNAHLPGARITHLETEARYAPDGAVGPIPIDTAYHVGGFLAMYPRAPTLPASESVHCHCTSITVLPESNLDTS